MTYSEDAEDRSEKDTCKDIIPVVFVVRDTGDADVDSHVDDHGLEEGPQQPASPPCHACLQVDLTSRIFTPFVLLNIENIFTTHVCALYITHSHVHPYMDDQKFPDTHFKNYQLKIH